ncbi:MAG TPA: protein-disulfide reductase DsbD N-terminal domain-containing protein [Pyrinomonadaceae bacterium]|nr:protein-disulfide reductase DsbD N-terminal domain-containing protein [Pyrinomonadaceae bacterium]
MRRKNYLRVVLLSSLALALFTFPVNFYADSNSVARTTAAPPATVALQPNISVNGFFATDKAQRGRTIQAAVVMEIPRDFHVNGNKPLGKYAVPTTLKVDASGGIRVGPVTYPRASVKSFSFSEERLAVYEGRVVMRFNITVPSGYDQGVTQLRVRLRYQSCTNEVCFPPQNRDISMPIAVVGANDPVKRINGNIFGGRRS